MTKRDLFLVFKVGSTFENNVIDLIKSINKKYHMIISINEETIFHKFHLQLCNIDQFLIRLIKIRFDFVEFSLIMNSIYDKKSPSHL